MRELAIHSIKDNLSNAWYVVSIMKFDKRVDLHIFTKKKKSKYVRLVKSFHNPYVYQIIMLNTLNILQFFFSITLQ